MVGYERDVGTHGCVPKRKRMEYSLDRSRIVPKATTLVPMFLVFPVRIDLLPSSMVKYRLVGRKPTGDLGIWL